MASLVPPGGKKDYFRELRLKRQAQMTARGDTPGGSSTPDAEAAIPITVVLAAEADRPTNPKKRKEDHGKDRGKSSRRHGGARHPEGLPREADCPGGRVQVGLTFLGMI